MLVLDLSGCLHDSLPGFGGLHRAETADHGDQIGALCLDDADIADFFLRRTCLRRLTLADKPPDHKNTQQNGWHYQEFTQHELRLCLNCESAPVRAAILAGK